MKKILVFFFFVFFFFSTSAYAQGNKWEFDYSRINNEETVCLTATFDEFDNDPIVDDSRLRKLLPTRRPSSKPARFRSDNDNRYFDKLKNYNTEMGATYDTENDTWTYNEVSYDTGTKLDKAIEVAYAIQEYEFTIFYKSNGHAVIYNTNNNKWEYGNVVIYNISDNTWVYNGNTYTSVLALDMDVFNLYETASEYSIHRIYNNKWSGIHCRQKVALREFYLGLSNKGGNNLRRPDPLYWPIDSPNNGIFDYEGINDTKGSSGSIYVGSINLSDYNLEGRIPVSMFLPGIFYGTSSYPVIHNTSSFDIRNNPELCIDSGIRQTFNTFKNIVTVSFSESYYGDVTDVIPDCSTTVTDPANPPEAPVTPPVGPVTPPVGPVTPPVSPPTGGTISDPPMYLRATAGNSQVELTWLTPRHTGGLNLTGYSYRMKLSNEGFFGTWTEIPGGSSVYAYTVTDLINGSEYIFEVRANNFHGGGIPARIRVTLPVITNTESEELPDEITLAGNYPNPFNPTTLITYRLTKPVHVYLAVHDITGRKITVLADGIRPAGEHRVTFDAKDLSTGHYIYTLHADGYAKARTMIFVK